MNKLHTELYRKIETKKKEAYWKWVKYCSTKYAHTICMCTVRLSVLYMQVRWYFTIMIYM